MSSSFDIVETTPSISTSSRRRKPCSCGRYSLESRDGHRLLLQDLHRAVAAADRERRTPARDAPAASPSRRPRGADGEAARRRRCRPSASSSRRPRARGRRTDPGAVRAPRRPRARPSRSPRTRARSGRCPRTAPASRPSARTRHAMSRTRPCAALSSRPSSKRRSATFASRTAWVRRRAAEQSPIATSAGTSPSSSRSSRRSRDAASSCTTSRSASVSDGSPVTTSASETVVPVHRRHGRQRAEARRRCSRGAPRTPATLSCGIASADPARGREQLDRGTAFGEELRGADAVPEAGAVVDDDRPRRRLRHDAAEQVPDGDDARVRRRMETRAGSGVAPVATTTRSGSSASTASRVAVVPSRTSTPSRASSRSA